MAGYPRIKPYGSGNDDNDEEAQRQDTVAATRRLVVMTYLSALSRSLRSEGPPMALREGHQRNMANKLDIVL
jgi:hypothetical protein